MTNRLPRSDQRACCGPLGVMTVRTRPGHAPALAGMVNSIFSAMVTGPSALRRQNGAPALRSNAARSTISGHISAPDMILKVKTANKVTVKGRAKPDNVRHAGMIRSAAAPATTICSASPPGAPRVITAKASGRPNPKQNPAIQARTRSNDHVFRSAFSLDEDGRTNPSNQRAAIANVGVPNKAKSKMGPTLSNPPSSDKGVTGVITTIVVASIAQANHKRMATVVGTRKKRLATTIRTITRRHAFFFTQSA